MAMKNGNCSGNYAQRWHNLMKHTIFLELLLNIIEIQESFAIDM